MEVSGEVWFPLLSHHQSCSVVSCYLACEFHFEGLLLVQTPERFGLMQRFLFPKRPLSHTVIYVSSWKFFCYPHANLLPAGVELRFFKSSSVWAVSKQGEQLDCCLSICTNSQFVLLTVTGHRACFECKHLLCLGGGGTDLWWTMISDKHSTFCGILESLKKRTN